MVDQLFSDVMRVLDQAAQYQIEHQSLSLSYEKKSRSEYVTEIDRFSEEIICEGLKRIIPEAGFYGEEFGKTGNQSLRWIVDPIDGTTNYLCGHDYYAISAALYSHDEGVFGAVVQPAKRKVWARLEDKSLCFDGKILTSMQIDAIKSLSLNDSLVATGFPYRSQDLRKPFSEAVNYSLDSSRGMRRFGSAALDLCYMASGNYGAFFESDLQFYDIAASKMFIETIGAHVWSELGEGYDVEKNRLFVTSFTSEAFVRTVSEIYRPYLN